MCVITIPKKLAPLVKAFTENDSSAKLLISEVSRAVSSSEGSLSSSRSNLSDEELEGVLALMKGICPNDTLEMIYGAQIISSHLMGLRLLSKDFPADQNLGLKLLRFSNDAMNQLQKKRSSGKESIAPTFTYSETISPECSPCQ